MASPPSENENETRPTLTKSTTMVPLSRLPLPLPPNGPPPGYGWEERDMSTSSESATAAFDTGIDKRDTFLGRPHCVICGASNPCILQHCYIFKDSGRAWNSLRERNWIPLQAKHDFQHEPRNGLVLCVNHRILFDAYDFFIRFIPEIRKFVFINYSGARNDQEFHGKAIALDIADHHAPFPSLFIIHEMRVRGLQPFRPADPAIPDEIAWQDWILSNGAFNEVSGTFNRDRPHNNPSMEPGSKLQLPPMVTSSDDTASGAGQHRLALNDNIIAEILAATHAMPSWRACEIEGTSWSGTAEENTEKYFSSFGVQDGQLPL